MHEELNGDAGSRQLELIADYACETGENPLWHPFEHRLYWTDIPPGRLFRYEPVNGVHEQFYQGRPVGGFTIQSDGSLLLFQDRGTIAIWKDGDIKVVVPNIPAERSSRFNDVIADPRGRVLCGTMSSGNEKGRLYRLDTDGSLHVLLEGIGCSNGMAFTPDGARLFYTDSFAFAVYVFDYDVKTGSISNQRVFARFDEAGGFPDGMTMDSDGNLWSAFWDGSCIARLSQDGSIAERISLPARKVSSLTYGGSDYRDVYVTTAGGNIKSEDGPSAGALFRFRAEVPGVPEFLSRIGL